MPIKEKLTNLVLFGSSGYKQASVPKSEQEEEFTLMHVMVKGREGDHPVEYKYELLDRYDPQTETSSMSRTTGYTCTAITRLILDGHYQHKGISPPEFVGATENCFQLILDDLKQRRVVYKGHKKIEDR